MAKKPKAQKPKKRKRGADWLAKQARTSVQRVKAEGRRVRGPGGRFRRA